MRRRRIAKLSVMMIGIHWQLRLLTAAFGTKGRSEMIYHSSAFGAKRTCTVVSPRYTWPLMTQTGHMPARNPAAQQSPAY